MPEHKGQKGTTPKGDPRKQRQKCNTPRPQTLNPTCSRKDLPFKVPDNGFYYITCVFSAIGKYHSTTAPFTPKP